MIGSPTIHDAETDHFVKLPDLSIHKRTLSPLQLVVYNSWGDTWRWKEYFTSQTNFYQIALVSTDDACLNQLLHWELQNGFSDSIILSIFINRHSSVNSLSLPFLLSIGIHGFFIWHSVIYYSFYVQISPNFSSKNLKSLLFLLKYS